MPAAVVAEADGGSRGNPGPAAYGAVLKDAATGAVIAEDGTRIGVASNNVAEYRGLIGALRLAAEHAPGADVEVRMDSRLVVEQMSGRWRIKHPSMRPLAAEAAGLAPEGVRYTWVPREQNAHADRLANEALDGLRDGVSVAVDPQPAPEGQGVDDPQVEAEGRADAVAGPDAPASPTTLVLVRHGVTAMTAGKRFSGGLGGSNPPLVEEGRAQVRASAEWLAPTAGRVTAVVASPVRRTRESAEIVAEVLQRPVLEEPGFAEMEFGTWDGLSFAEVGERDRAGLDAWLASLDEPAGGSGESLREVRTRVLAGLARVLDAHRGATLVVVSHVTPIKVIVAEALGAPLESVFALELSPAAVSVVTYHPAVGSHPARAVLRLFNARPPGDDALAAATSAW